MQSDYKEQLISRLEQSIIYRKLSEKCGTIDPEVMALIYEAVDYANQRTKTIIRHMGEFTLHDSDHLFRVLHIMGRLIGADNIDNYSIPELQLLILSAFFHDIGMAPSESDIIAWKKNYDATPTFDDQNELAKYYDFQRFYHSNPDSYNKINYSIQNGDNTLADNIKAILLTEFIRKSHADRAREIIDSDWSSKIKFRNVDLTVELASICYSHNQNAKTLNDLDKGLLCGADISACLPLIGILLRLADILDFDGKRTPNILFNHLSIKNPISLLEWQKHRSVEAWEIDSNKIQFSAKCSHPVIEASIHSFCDIIDEELSICNNLISEINAYHKLNIRNLEIKIPNKVIRDKILTKKDIYGKPIYIFRNTKFELSKRQVIELLMGTKLYGNQEVALRELIQNSIDACLLRQSQEKKWGNKYEPKIEINLYSKEGDDFLEVTDNGTGMDQDIIDNYYSKVGSSFYKSSDFYLLKSESNSDFNPTSRFGIGILSSFMISDTLQVETRRVLGSHDYSDSLKVTIEGQESIFYITSSKRTEPGTLTKLCIRKNQNPWVHNSNEQFIESVENLIPKPPFDITITRNGQTKTINESSFLAKSLDSLKDHTWNNLENLNVFEFEFDESGLKGKARIGILEKNGNPIKNIFSERKSVEIQGIDFPLSRNIYISINKLSQESTIITVDDSGNINTSDNNMDLLKSKCKISFHGIEVPYNIVPEPWYIKPNLANLQWPIQFLMLFDISGNYDLDLNSSRTEILNSEKWIKVETDLAQIFAKNIKYKIGQEKWNDLKVIYAGMTSNIQFLNGINLV